jgi:hypothetical protein
MPPRHTYWTIIVDDLPTAFRAAKRDELLPTFERLRAKHPSARLQWFARGRLWDSPEQAEIAERMARTEKRGRDWRPGGQHRDPRDRFDKKKRARDRAAREAARQPSETRGEGWRDDRRAARAPAKPKRPFAPGGKPGGAAARRPHGARSTESDRRGQRPFDGRRGSPPRESPPREGWSRPGSPKPHAGGRDRRSESRPPKPEHRSRREHRPDDRQRGGKGPRDSRAAWREALPGRKPDYRSPRPPRRPAEERPERRRPAPPRPAGPDREPKPGSEPPAVPSRSDEIITPAPPPERGQRVSGPRGTRLMKRPPRSRE